MGVDVARALVRPVVVAGGGSHGRDGGSAVMGKVQETGKSELHHAGIYKCRSPRSWLPAWPETKQSL